MGLTLIYFPSTCEGTLVSVTSPGRGEVVTELRPIITVSQVEEAEAYMIQISPEPDFTSINTITYVSPPTPSARLDKDRSQKVFQPGLASKYVRYPDKLHQPWQWKVPYNLTVMLSYPYGYRIVPCRRWLRFLSERVVEGHTDPLLAIHSFVAFGIQNEGSASDYHDAYQMLSRDKGVCGHYAELTAAMAASCGYRSRLLILNGLTGHVVAHVQRHTGEWVLMDSIYNFVITGKIEDILARVKEEPDYLTTRLWYGATYRFRDLLHNVNYANRYATTLDGIKYDVKDSPDEATQFQDLAWKCSSEMLAEVEKQKLLRLTNIFFVRAASVKDGKQSEWSKSYFVFRPRLMPDEKYVDNVRNLWGNGNRLPTDFQ